MNRRQWMGFVVCWLPFGAAITVAWCEGGIGMAMQLIGVVATGVIVCVCGVAGMFLLTSDEIQKRGGWDELR